MVEKEATSNRRSKRPLSESPLYVSKHHDRAFETPDLGDRIEMEEPKKINIPTNKTEVFHSLLRPYRCADTDLNLERMAMFVHTIKKPGDELYLVRQVGGWSQSYWVLLNPEEHRELMRNLVGMSLSEARCVIDDALDKSNWPLLANIVNVSSLIHSIGKRYGHAVHLQGSQAILEEIERKYDSEVANHLAHLMSQRDIRRILDWIYEEMTSYGEPPESVVALLTPEFQRDLELAKTNAERAKVSHFLDEQ